MDYTVGSVYFKYDKSRNPDPEAFTMHIHDKCEIFYFAKGSVEYLVEGSKYPLSENSVMIMRPTEAHTPKILRCSCYERYAVNFPLSFVQTIDPEGRLLKAFTDRPLGRNNFYSDEELDMVLFKRLLEEMRGCPSEEYERRLTASTHIGIMLDMINRAFIRKKSGEYAPKSLPEKIIVYIEKHLSEEISVPLLASHFHLSVSQFSRIFRQATGASPWDYITKKRLTIAKKQIQEGSAVKDVFEKSGFKDYSSFYRAYTKLFNCSPQSNKQTISSP
ncbi:MAG: helix-turn-helix transcriptional regulator [Ruminiclostridium sp.]|nr:helix-turn-helix transcriptional regulator [Ruminiclostridium sp.]